ncbi:hypothetical protein GIB67_036349 [Kingdonia uniflora]|uniref:Cytochrome P450 n=1 Tax=Kingdonia uniflora TaxID=39325 RepID=A0A7J7L419_9MAGN|nr:hypothetical protein GIB67_036349 [Kingdonia uniflora]
MVIKESLRIHPPGSVLIPRECMSHCIINEYDINPKMWVLINIWAIARDLVLWKNPEEFLPKRFIDCPIDFKGKDFEFLPSGTHIQKQQRIGLRILRPKTISHKKKLKETQKSLVQCLASGVSFIL